MMTVTTISNTIPMKMTNARCRVCGFMISSYAPMRAGAPGRS